MLEHDLGELESALILFKINCTSMPYFLLCYPSYSIIILHYRSIQKGSFRSCYYARQPNLQKFLICFYQGFGKPMFANYKSLMIWAGGNSHFLGFLGLTLSHRIWKSSVLWNYGLMPFFFSNYTGQVPSRAS